MALSDASSGDKKWLFQVIVDDLEAAISNGDYELGQQLPSQHELQAPEPIEGEEVEILDSLAKDVPLFPYRKGDHPLKVETAQVFFDSSWDQLAQEATFDN